MDENNTQDSTNVDLTALERQLLTQIDGLVIERDALTAVINEHQHQIVSDVELAFTKAKLAIIEVLQDQVNSTLEPEDASVIFAEFANRLGKYGIWANPFKLKYTVSVEHEYSDILVISGVEAEDEEDAIDLVKEDLSLEDCIRKGTLTYSGKFDCDDSAEVEDSNESFDWEEFDITFSAERE
jgi:hypothetical protein